MKYVKKPIEIETIQIHGNVTEIKDFKGEFYPCKKDIFEQIYELVR